MPFGNAKLYLPRRAASTFVDRVRPLIRVSIRVTPLRRSRTEMVIRGADDGLAVACVGLQLRVATEV